VVAPSRNRRDFHAAFVVLPVVLVAPGFATVLVRGQIDLLELRRLAAWREYCAENVVNGRRNAKAREERHLVDARRSEWDGASS
jgi:hypothetical protein